MSRFFKSAAFPIIIVILLAYFAQRMLLGSSSPDQKETWTTFLQRVDNGQVTSIHTNIQEFSLQYKTDPNSDKTITIGIPSEGELNKALAAARKDDANVVVDSAQASGSPWWSVLTYVLPFVLFFAFWIFLMNQVQGGGSKVMSFGKSRAKRLSVDSPKITFKDVAGV